MSDNGSGGVLGGLLIGVGFFTIVLTPFYIAYRFGVHVLALVTAVLATIYALISPWLVAMAKAPAGGTGSTAGAFDSVSRLILQMDAIGWWQIAAFMWVNAILMALAVVVRGSTGAATEGEG